MSPKPFSSSQYDDPTPSTDLEWCQDCQRHHWDGLGHVCDGLAPARGIVNGLICSVVIIACVIAAAWIWTSAAQGKQPRPVPAPEALLRARAACPVDKPLKCRAALRRAYASVEWQKQARWHKAAGQSTDVVRDAIAWASAQTGVPAWRMIRIGTCESHLFWLAQTGQFKGWAQLGAMHRSDPIFRVVPWQDPYAQAIHMARFIKRHGEGQWQCTSSGGLRW